jgi:WhiB family transcriptional regulator, redox-sensing transcriptional regulator
MSRNDPWEPHLFDKVPGEWFDSAACRGEPADWFFPPRSGHHSQVLGAKGKAVCATCTVQAECLDFAETPPVEQFGLWGGMTTDERRRARNKTNSKKGAK